MLIDEVIRYSYIVLGGINMTYAELIKCYPWIDLAMELFKGIAPTVIAFVTIFLTEYFVKRRNDTYKKREMKLQYLEKC